MKRFVFTALFFFLVFTPVALVAQGLQVTADESLEWVRDQNQYKAVGNARAVQGDLAVQADELVADYAEASDQSRPDIHTLTATGNVSITTPSLTATGTTATYAVKTDIMTLNGPDVTITIDDSILTAKDRVILYRADNRADALGGVRVVQGDQTITAPLMTAWFTSLAESGARFRSLVAERGVEAKDPQNTLTAQAMTAFFEADGQTVRSIEATGDVVIITPTETLKAQTAQYNPQTGKANLRRAVQIIRGANTLVGDAAEYDSRTGVSRMVAGQGGRVIGVFSDSDSSGTTPSGTTPSGTAP